MASLNITNPLATILAPKNHCHRLQDNPFQLWLFCGKANIITSNLNSCLFDALFPAIFPAPWGGYHWPLTFQDRQLVVRAPDRSAPWGPGEGGNRAPRLRGSRLPGRLLLVSFTPQGVGLSQLFSGKKCMYVYIYIY